MVTMVITLNIALAILCLGIAWKLHQIKHSLRRATRWLIIAEHSTDQFLYEAPYSILLGQSGIKYGREKMDDLNALPQQIIRLLAFLKLFQQVRQHQVRFLQRRLTPRTQRLR
jgi:hypothetical protein